MLRLRTADGLDMYRVQRDFGQHVVQQLGPVLDRHAAAGRVQLLDAAGSCVSSFRHAHQARLSDPDGFLLSNAVISDLFAALDAMPAKVGA
jgi:oxygen-independent coproporphyrinogen-3 oxidase